MSNKAESYARIGLGHDWRTVALSEKANVDLCNDCGLLRIIAQPGSRTFYFTQLMEPFLKCVEEQELREMEKLEKDLMENQASG